VLSLPLTKTSPGQAGSKLAKPSATGSQRDTGPMTARHLFLIGYDIAQPRRLRQVLRCVQGHALGGQKSFYECRLSVAELQDLMARLRQIIEPEDDRVVFVRLDARSQSIALGCAEPIASTDYFLVG
jgi:CRISPR-associated protein Cas2